MSKKIKIKQWKSDGVAGAKRAHIGASDWMEDWFVGWGKDTSCQFEGTWWDMICFARNVLANPNTEMAAPEFYMPELKVFNYTGEEKPYEFEGEED